MISHKFTLELCCHNLESVSVAQEAHLDRIELCSALSEGGLTPSLGLITQARRLFDGNIMVMLRPRRGDFIYSNAEFESMKDDIIYCKALGINGFVLGILTEDASVDVERTCRLVELANPLQVCFHRAIDMTSDLALALEDVIECGCRRILSSGLMRNALEGAGNLQLLQQRSAQRIEIMAGSGINNTNIAAIFAQTSITQFHFSASTIHNSSSLFRNENLLMGGEGAMSEYEVAVADFNQVLSIKTELAKLL